MFRRKRENKAKLEHKLYLAREKPDEVFDLCECDLYCVPTGIYSLCRVFLKTKLTLSYNNLSSLNGGGSLGDLRLLTILAIDNNAFTSLPNDIQLLINLKELYIQNNQIKVLPLALGHLPNLRYINVSNNLLKDLPETMGNLCNLNTLILTGNNKLKQLPRSLCHAHCLSNLEIDFGSDFKYPPSNIMCQGIETIMKYICDDNNVEYIHKESVDVNCDYLGVKEEEDPHAYVEAKVWELEKRKEQKLQDLLAIERSNELLQRQEIDLANSFKVNREKLLADITRHQNLIDESLDKFQQIREFEHFKLVEQLKEAEENADIAIKHLLQMNKEPLALLLEQELIEQDKILAASNKYNENLCKKDILNSMEELLEKERIRFERYDTIRNESSKAIFEQDCQQTSLLLEIFHSQDNRNEKLATQLQEDSDLQKVAVATLLERSDARSWSLVQQVKLIESQLAALTTIEMDRKKLEIDKQVNDLAEKRVNLSILLLDLLEEQKMRKMQLMAILQSLEDNMEDENDYWLRQYQLLLSRMPEGFSDIQRNMDFSLIQALLNCGVLNYLPFLAKLSQSEEILSNSTDEDLSNVGIKNSDDRAKILDAFTKYKRRVKSNIPSPSAPPVPNDEASAPPLTITQSYCTSECVVCMDHKCEIIYVPCGHFCCCIKCAEMTITECPMCRSPIDSQIIVDQS